MTCPPAAQQPTLPGFIAWVRSAMGIPTQALPDDSVFFGYAYGVSTATVNQQLQVAGGPIYMLAVYNLGGSLLINWAPDPSPPFPFPTNNPDGLGYFSFLRQKFDTLSFVGGVVSGAGDEGTSDSIEVVEVLKRLTPDQLQNLKDPWGRTYLGFASKVGSNWGVT